MNLKKKDEKDDREVTIKEIKKSFSNTFLKAFFNYFI